MTEPDVTLTDYVLSLECALFAYFLPNGPVNGLLRWFRLFFLALSLASLAGGSVHGFFLDENSTGYRLLWPITLSSIGVAALALMAISLRLLIPSIPPKALKAAGIILWVVYALVIIRVTQNFRVAILAYLPSLLLFAASLAVQYRKNPNRRLALGIAGIALSLSASGIQQLHVGIHPVYFNHNALYHLLQGIALFLIFKGAQWLGTRHGRPIP